MGLPFGYGFPVWNTNPVQYAAFNPAVPTQALAPNGMPIPNVDDDNDDIYNYRLRLGARGD